MPTRPMTIYPLAVGQSYTVGQLRAAEADLLVKRQADQKLSSALRLQSRQEIPWAKTRNEEWAPLSLLVDGLGLNDNETFQWSPDGAADFQITCGNDTLNLQCTMAYDQLEKAEYLGGHLHHLEMKWSHANDGFFFPGGKISEPTARDCIDDLRTWRAGIANAVRAKLGKPNYEGHNLCLLVYARNCRFGTIDTPFSEVVLPALDIVGTENWGQVFERIYVVDHKGFASAHR
jgi:hypothetical protein